MNEMAKRRKCPPRKIEVLESAFLRLEARKQRSGLFLVEAHLFSDDRLVTALSYRKVKGENIAEKWEQGARACFWAARTRGIPAGDPFRKGWDSVTATVSLPDGGGLRLPREREEDDR